MESSADTTTGALPAPAQMARQRRKRRARDAATRWLVKGGGGAVVVALALIFVYLFSEVYPLLRGARVAPATDYGVPGAAGAETASLALDRYGDLGVRISTDGRATFWELASGRVRASMNMLEGVQAEVTATARGEPRTRLTGLGLSDGRMALVEHGYDLTFPGDRRHLEPRLSNPLGDEPVVLDPEGRAIQSLAVQYGSNGYGAAAYTADGRLLLVRFDTRRNFLSGETEITPRRFELPSPGEPLRHLILSANLWNLVGATASGDLLYYDVARPAQAVLRGRVAAVAGGSVTALAYLNGTFSFVTGGSDGSVVQWFLVRDEQAAERNVFRLERARSFEPHAGAVTAIAPEYTRKGFVTTDEAGGLGIHYGTSARTLFHGKVAPAGIVAATVSPVERHLMLQDAAGAVRVLQLDNPHPEYSFRALWNKVWYEGRAEPEYVWQSSSGSDSFEPKFSMVPLTVGTLKAAFFAMLFAVPLAIAGAVYTAYFMAPRMRRMVKPTIEIMEALPTVILGFLAGLWFAPFVENHLPAVFMTVFGLPVAFLLAAFAWSRLPARLRALVPEGWEAAILIPVVGLTMWSAVCLSPHVELWLFDGSVRQWLTNVGITYDQRNALVVGMAMGFAVIPTIFSIAEDAVFTVPRHLTQGSLALGATPWQTVTRVVLLTASPGIFSAVMIGLGRAVGETMIVLMATGNSPVVNFNLFEGMRTLSANIAVELPETAVGSTHYRLLFYAALVLFAMTFILNTIAEIVRQRLRARYSSL